MTPSLDSQIADLIDAKLDGVYTSFLAAVVSYDAPTQTASVRPLVKIAHTDESGERVVEELPVLSNVPVMHLGGGGFALTFPLTKNDPLLIVCSMQAIDKWYLVGATGEDTKPLDPESDRRFTISDAIAIPGVRNFAGKLTTTPVDGMTLGSDTTAANIKITSTDIQAGGTGELATKADLDALKTYIDTHVHIGVTTGSGTSGAPSLPAPTPAGTTVLKGG